MLKKYNGLSLQILDPLPLFSAPSSQPNGTCGLNQGTNHVETRTHAHTHAHTLAAGRMALSQNASPWLQKLQVEVEVAVWHAGSQPKSAGRVTPNHPLGNPQAGLFNCNP